MKPESLNERVNRAKARWLKRVMYASNITSTQKCFAYAIADHLNCVTLDCWPGQLTLVRLLGRRSIKTAQRAARALQAIGAISIKRMGRDNSDRYAPVFLPGDEDKNVTDKRQSCPELVDTNVHESLLKIQLRSSSTEAPAKQAKKRSSETRAYDPAKRGAIELELARQLGANGFEILQVLSEMDEAILDRLCRAFFAGAVGDRELAAARLAAQQVRSRPSDIAGNQVRNRFPRPVQPSALKQTSATQESRAEIMHIKGD